MVPGMMNSSSRTILRTAQSSVRHLRPTGARFVSTQPPHLRSRSWKSSALRWGIAGAGIYYYNTSPVFAEQPHHNLLNPNVDGPHESEEISALEDLISRRSKDVQKTREELAADASIGHSPDVPLDGSQGAAALEEEAQGEGAFNPETGEINWDCPCLGGMAHGPCGPQFREAFSCFVFSTEEPKGMDCIEKFQGMRDCFQEHPEVYKDELMEDEELDAELEAEKQDLVNQIAERRKAEEAASGSGHRLLEEPVPASKSSKPSRNDDSTPPSKPSQRGAETAWSKPADTAPSTSKEHLSVTTNSSPTPNTSTRPETDDRDAEGQDSSVHRQVSPPPVSQEEVSASDELLPKAAHDARDSVGPAGQPPKKE